MPNRYLHLGVSVSKSGWGEPIWSTRAISGLADDAEIIAHVDEITALLLAASVRAWRADN